jgi:nitrogen fixation/metabolism regulation signal transduction histidine kinase
LKQGNGPPRARFSLRTRILVYLVLLHVVLASISVVVLLEEPVLLLVFEGLFVVSLVVGYLLVRAFFVPLELIRTGAELMRERDFTTHFREVGQSEMDELIRIYNEMAERLRQERVQLEERNLFIDQVVRASPTGVVVLEHDGSVADLNHSAARLLEAGGDELCGRKLDEVPSPLGTVLSGLEPEQSRVVSVRGRRLRCLRATFFDRGAPRSFYLVDELTAELRAIERAAYGKVIRMMSHEVRNSVGAVRSLLESCGTYGRQLSSEDRGDFEQALDVAASRLQHLNAFMDAIASVVRVPAPEKRPCDVLGLLGDLELLLRPELERRRIRLRWEAAEPLTDVALDKNQFEQVLVNVLRNAMEAIGEGGEIVLASGRDGGRRWLAIRDSGPGIDDELQAGLATPFFSTKRDGQGVGLTLSREILTRHGFHFALDNRETGGAEFRIRF